MSPHVEWRFRIGGAVSADDVLVQDATATTGARVFVATGGRLQGFDGSGSVVFDRNPRIQLSLIGAWDFGGDGHRQVLAATSETATNRLMLFSAESGDLLWESPQTDGQIGSVKVLGSQGGSRLVWLPAASSRVSLFDFAGRLTDPMIVWQTDVTDFVSDPYTYSSIGLGDLGQDGKPSIVIAGARGSVAVIVLNATTGIEEFRVVYPDVHGFESGGEQQLLHVGDLDGSGHDYVLCVSSHGSESQWMFQGATVVNPDDPGSRLVLDTAPVGLRYVPGSVADFNGDGRLELLVSRYSLVSRRHELLLLDGSTLTVLSRYPNFYLLALTMRSDGSHDVLGIVDGVSEIPQSEGVLAGLRFSPDDFAFHEAWRRSDQVDLGGSLIRAKGVGSLSTDNPGSTPVILRDDGDDLAKVVFRRWLGVSTGTDLVAIRLHDGATLSRYGPTDRFNVLGAASGGSREKSRLILGTADGDVVFLDGSLAVKGRVSVGGYSQAHALNAHSYELAAVADLDGSGQREIAVVDSQNRILRLLRGGKGPGSEPSAQVLASTSIPQELCITTSTEGGRIFVVGSTGSGPKLSMIDGLGRTLWSHAFNGTGTDALEDAAPIGLNVGRFGPSGAPGVVLTGGSTRDLPRTTYALDAESGGLLWKTAPGTGGWWDASAAVTDADRDGRDDVVINANDLKAFLVSGSNGIRIGDPLTLPAFGDLGPVDYNGAPVVVRRTSDGVRILIAQDDAHLSLVSVGGPECGDAVPCPARLVWASPQASLDAERRSMAALAPTSDGGVMIGVGSHTGDLRAVRERDGQEMWRVRLTGGRVASDSTTRSGPLSSVLALDVDGDGRNDFVVGGSDGWLYALDAETGRLVWSLDLGAPVGDPIAADFDNLGVSKILVAAADGYLYAVGPGSSAASP